jgi:Skp family chaperone for outer membrane proteins
MLIRILALLAIACIAKGQGTIATIRLQIATVSTRDGIRASSELGAAFAGEFAWLESEQNRVKAEQTQLQRMNTARLRWLHWKRSARKRLSSRLAADTRALQRRADEDRVNFEKERSRILAILGGRMNQVVEEYARHNGYSRIVDTTTEPAPPGARDVTSDVIADYNNQFTDNISFIKESQP